MMIENALKEKIEEIEKIKLVSAVYKKDEKVCYLTFLVSASLSFDAQKNAKQICEKMLEVKCDIKFKKAIYDDDAVLFVVKNFLKLHYPNILQMQEAGDLSIQKTDENKVNITFKLIEDLKNLVEKNGFSKLLKSELDEHFFEEFSIIFEEKSMQEGDQIIDEMKRKVDISAPKEEDLIVMMKVSGAEALFGESIQGAPIAIKCIKEPTEGVNICGKVCFFAKRSFKRKKKKGDQEERFFFSFVLNDGTGKMHCTYFPTKMTMPKMEKIVDGTEIVCFGAVELFNDRLSFKPKDISLCLSFEPIQKKIVYKTVPSAYKAVFPEEYAKPRQLNLLGEELGESLEVCDFLKNNKVVVFDLETTGLFFDRDDIIEIGACLIEDGQITKTFETLVKPSFPIPAEATKVNNITNEMVAASPSYSEVVGDFYKFCDGAVMVAYNAGFDKSFIDFHSEKLLYRFENKVIDAMVVAQSQLKGLRNYKLKTVLEKLGIINEGAHRAVHDAIATAKAFIALAKNL